jgi:hypothetical protein
MTVKGFGQNEPYSLDQWQYIEIDNDRDRYGDTLGPSTLAYFGLGWGDADDDSDLDLVSGRYFYRNPGGEMSAAWASIDLTAGNTLDVIDAMLMVDVDGDNRADVIGSHATYYEGEVYWLEADDQYGTSWSAYMIDGDAPYGSHLNPQGYTFGELVNGGKPEIVISNGSFVFYYEIPETNPEAGNWPRTIIVDQSNDEDVDLGDIDGDGLLDVATAHKPGGEGISIKWARNPGDGSANWTEYIIGQAVPEGNESIPDRLKVADLNGDGKLDIVVSEESPYDGASTYWYEAPADPTQIPWARHHLVTQYTTNSMDVADMDNDGAIDIVLQEHRGTEKLSIWANDGSGNFTEYIVDTGKEGHLGARLADLDNDGDLEIFSICWDSYAYLHLWRNDNGPGTDPINYAPVAYDDSFTVEHGGSYDGLLHASDANEDPMTFEQVDPPSHGYFTGFNTETGAYTYVADTDYVGTDSFTFRAFDGQAYSNTAVVDISIVEANHPPVALFTASPNNGKAPLIVLFNAASSYDPDGTIVDYAWDFGDNSPAAYGSSVSHKYTSPALYTARLTVEDDSGLTTSTFHMVRVNLNDNGQVGYWPFDENGGTTGKDYSGYENHAILQAGAGWGVGKFGSALSLNGSGGYAARPDADLNGTMPAHSTNAADDFSVAAWIKLNTLNKRHPLVQKQGNGQRGFNFTVESNNHLAVEFYKGQESSDESELSDPGALQAGHWYHIVVTYDFVTDGTSRARLYRDGVLVAGNDNCVGPVTGNTVDLNFGRYFWSDAFQWYMDGMLDEVRIYERTLSSEGVVALYNSEVYSPADFNQDLQVNGTDRDLFIGCQTAPGIPQLDPQCAEVRLDGDEDVDQADFAIFQSEYTGTIN